MIQCKDGDVADCDAKIGAIFDLPSVTYKASSKTSACVFKASDKGLSPATKDYPNLSVHGDLYALLDIAGTKEACYSDLKYLAQPKSGVPTMLCDGGNGVWRRPLHTTQMEETGAEFIAQGQPRPDAFMDLVAGRLSGRLCGGVRIHSA